MANITKNTAGNYMTADTTYGTLELVETSHLEFHLHLRATDKHYKIEFTYDDHVPVQNNHTQHFVVPDDFLEYWEDNILCQYSFDVTDDEDIDNYIYECIGDESGDTSQDPELERELMMFPTFREVARTSNGMRLYFNPMGLAGKWFTGEEVGTAAYEAKIDALFRYIYGWYHDEWHYMVMRVVPLVPNCDDELIEMTECDTYLGGIESLSLELEHWNPAADDNAQYLFELITDQIYECERLRALEIAPGQMNLALVH